MLFIDNFTIQLYFTVKINIPIKHVYRFKENNNLNLKYLF